MRTTEKTERGVPMRILIIEDEKLLADSLEALLRAKGYETEARYDGESGAEAALQGNYDLLILDIMLPGMNGYDIARKIRAARSNVPILMLTAKADLEDRIEGLNAGADYYLSKPFDVREFLASVNVLLRRQDNQADEYRYGNTRLDISTGRLVCGDRKIRLSSREYEVMRLLFQTKEQVLSKESILSQVWGLDSNAVENHVEVYVGFLRKKLVNIGSNVRIVAIRGLGYHLEPEKE